MQAIYATIPTRARGEIVKDDDGKPLGKITWAQTHPREFIHVQALAGKKEYYGRPASGDERFRLVPAARNYRPNGKSK